MNPKRIACKFPVRGDPTAPVELQPFIAMFHKFIQEGALDGLLLDVADYAHVPDGPGVMLIGHDVDYGIDRAGGVTGLLTTRKRYGDLPLADAARSVLRSALRAIDAIERDGTSGLRFETGNVTIQLIDQLATPNDAANYAAAAAALASVLQDLYGEKHETEHVRADDPRSPLAIAVTAREPSSAAELAQRLGVEATSTRRAATPRAAEAIAKQSDWDISVEDLEKLREDRADFVLIDVREQREFDICNLGGDLIPLGSLAARIDDLDASAHVVVHCRTGGRSAKAVQALRHAGFENAWNVQGGILAWIDRIDPSLTRY